MDNRGNFSYCPLQDKDEGSALPCSAKAPSPASSCSGGGTFAEQAEDVGRSSRALQAPRDCLGERWGHVAIAVGDQQGKVRVLQWGKIGNVRPICLKKKPKHPKHVWLWMFSFSKLSHAPVLGYSPVHIQWHTSVLLLLIRCINTVVCTVDLRASPGFLVGVPVDVFVWAYPECLDLQVVTENKSEVCMCMLHDLVAHVFSSRS